LPGSALITRAVKIIDMIWISKLVGTAWGMDQVGHDERCAYEGNGQIEERKRWAILIK
jgi:hypothetical protein